MKKVTKYIKIVFFVLIFVLLISNLMLLKNIINGLEKIDAEIKINTEKFESKIEDSNKIIFEKQEIISEMLFSIYENTTFQIKQSQNINETYGKVLEE